MKKKIIYNPQIHHRRSIRLKGYDYTQSGRYFITLCCQNRACILSKIKMVDNEKRLFLNEAGEMMKREWLALKERFINIELHEYVIMPNHFHGIIEIKSDVGVGAGLVGASLVDAQENHESTALGATTRDALTPTIGAIIGAFKSITTVEYIRGVKENNWPPFEQRLWQRNYYEHIVRNERAFINISNYIINNPLNWDLNKFDH